MRLDDCKHTEDVKLHLTERELLDVARLSAAEDRKPAEYIRKVLRDCMYGSLAAHQTRCEGT